MRRYEVRFAPEPHRPAARRQRAHGAVQLAARARPAGHVHPAHRGHRRRAIDARVGGGDPARPALARARLGRRAGRRRRARAVSAVRAAAPLSVVREGAAERRHAYYCFCSTRSSTPSARRRWPKGVRRATPARAAGCRASRRTRASPPASGRRSGSACPEDRDVVFDDVVRGDVRFQTDVIGDPVIVRADGHPAYNFAVVVDDALMEVTHVIRGEDHISNTPRQILLYEALGFTPPTFAHLALVMGPDHSPLSKRHGATSVAEFRAKGYLPEALVNYLALIGWSPRRRRRAAADRRAGAPLFARGGGPQRRRVRRREARVGEPPLPEDRGSGAARGAVAAVLQRRRRADDARRARPRVSRLGDGDGERVGRSARTRCRRGWRFSSTTTRRRRWPIRGAAEMRAEARAGRRRARWPRSSGARRGSIASGSARWRTEVKARTGQKGEGAVPSDSRRADRPRRRAGARSRGARDRSRRRSAARRRDSADRSAAASARRRSFARW